MSHGPLSSATNGSFQISTIPEFINGQEEEFEISLLRLGVQFCTTLNNVRLSILLQENFDMILPTIHQSLRLALCAHGKLSLIILTCRSFLLETSISDQHAQTSSKIKF